MNAREKQLINTRLKKLNLIVKELYKVKGEKRDQKLINETLERVKKLQMWLNPVEVKKVMSKEEFREKFNKEFNITAPDTTMRINDLEELKKAWPFIKGKNILIEAPEVVKNEIKRLYKELAGNMKIDGFR